MQLKPQSTTDTFFIVYGNEIWVSIWGGLYLTVGLILIYRARSHRRISAKIEAGDVTGVTFDFIWKPVLLSLGLGTVYLGGYYWLGEQLAPYWWLFAPNWFLLLYLLLILAPMWQLAFAVNGQSMTSAILIDSGNLTLYKPIITESFPLKSIRSCTPNLSVGGIIRCVSLDIDLEVLRTRNGRREVDILEVIPILNRLPWSKGLGDIIAANTNRPSTQLAYQALLMILNRSN